MKWSNTHSSSSALPPTTKVNYSSKFTLVLYKNYANTQMPKYQYGKMPKHKYGMNQWNNIIHKMVKQLPPPSPNNKIEIIIRIHTSCVGMIQIHKCPNTCTEKCPNTNTEWTKATICIKFIGIHTCLVSKLYKCTNAQIPVRKNAQIPVRKANKFIYLIWRRERWGIWFDPCDRHRWPLSYSRIIYRICYRCGQSRNP